ncbi:MAG: chromate transporter [Dongiaceae bacterium]
MKSSLLGQLAITFASLSLIAIGGANSVIPEMHRQVVTLQGWMSDNTFANLFAIAQAAPGPNVLVVSLIGWHLAGWSGLAVATIAMCGPSCVLAFFVSRLRDRMVGARWLKILQAALVPIAIGAMAASGFVMAQAADSGLLDIALTAGTTLMVFFTRCNPLWALTSGAAFGMLAYLLA